MPAPVKRGQFVWHELMSTDPDAAAGFYGKLIGWKTQSFPQDPSYRMWMVGGTPVGGLMRLPEDARRMGSPPSWVTYIGVPDVDAAARQASSLGGRVHVAPTDIPGAGRFSVLGDPQGATFAVYRDSSSQPPPEAPKVGGFTWHELATTDHKAAWDFYRKMFGWVHTSSFDMGPAGDYFMFGLGGPPLGGIYNKPLEIPMPNWLPYISVKSVDAVAAATPRQGGRVLNAPMEVPGGDRIATGLDPQGAAFAVHWSSPAHGAGAQAVAKPKKKAAQSKPKAKPKKKAKTRAKAKARPQAKKRRR